MRTILYFIRAYPGQTAFVFGCLVVAALVEGIGFSALLPLLTVATGGDLEDPNLSGYEGQVRAWAEWAGVGTEFGGLIAVVALAFWVKGGVLLLSKQRVGYTVARVATDLRLALLKALLETRWGYYTRQPIGATTNAISTEADRVATAYQLMAVILGYVPELIVYGAIAFAISWKAALVVVGAAGITASALSVFVGMARRAGEKQTLIMKSLMRLLTDTLGAAKLLKASGREGSISNLLAKETHRLNRMMRRRVLARESLRALQEPILMTVICAGAYVAFVLYDMSISSLGMLGFMSSRGLSRLNSLQSKYQSMSAEASALWSILETTEHARAEREETSGEREPRLEDCIELRGVTVTYGENEVLTSADVKIPVHRLTALIGPSGAGKTTLADLVLGLVQPAAGEVLIDGIPLHELDLRKWRRMIGYVPQEMLLLHDTLRANITLGETDISDADIERALRDAGAWEFVSAHPDGIDAVAGERGALFSGGQRQRISIARALVHEPALLVLDEATAALDAESEEALWATVERLREKTTILAISHQPRVLDIADRVYRVDGGRALQMDPVEAGRTGDGVSARAQVGA